MSVMLMAESETHQSAKMGPYLTVAAAGSAFARLEKRDINSGLEMARSAQVDSRSAQDDSVRYDDCVKSSNRIKAN